MFQLGISRKSNKVYFGFTSTGDSNDFITVQIETIHFYNVTVDNIAFSLKKKNVHTHTYIYKVKYVNEIIR